MSHRLVRSARRLLPIIIIGFLVALLFREHIMAILFTGKPFAQRSLIIKIGLLMIFGGCVSLLFGVIYFVLNLATRNRIQVILDRSGTSILKLWNTCIAFLHPCTRFFEDHPWYAIIPVLGSILIMFWPTPNSYYSSDVGYYLSLAKNIFYGKGYIYPDLSPAFYRGPIFPLMIALFYKLFGNHFVSAIIMERFFWALTVLITYILGTELFNHRVGFGASILVLATSVINIVYQYVWTDGIVTFLILLIQFLLWYILTKSPGTKSYLLLGFLFGIAYFVKQTAIVIVPLPILLWLIFPDFRNRQNLKKILISYAVFISFILAWMVYIYSVGGPAGQILMDFKVGSNVLSYITKPIASGNIVSIGDGDGITRDSSILEIFQLFYYRDLVDRFWWFAPICLFSILYSMIQVIFYRSKSDIFILLGLFLYATVVPVNVVADFGPRGYLYLYVIMLICAIAFFDRIFIPISKPASFSIILILIIVAVFLQKPFRGPIIAKNQKTLDYFSERDNVADWIDTHTKTSDRIITSERDSFIFHILTEGNRDVFAIHPCLGETTIYLAERCSPPYISMWVYNGVTDPDTPRDILMGISEEPFISKIQENDIKYVIVTPNIYSLYYYLIQHPGFEEVTIIDGRYAVFRVVSSVRPIAEYPDKKLTTCIGDGTRKYFRLLQKKHPEKYQALMDEKITPWMGLSKNDLKGTVSSRECIFNPVFPDTY